MFIYWPDLLGPGGGSFAPRGPSGGPRHNNLIGGQGGGQPPGTGGGLHAPNGGPGANHQLGPAGANPPSPNGKMQQPQTDQTQQITSTGSRGSYGKFGFVQTTALKHKIMNL